MKKSCVTVRENKFSKITLTTTRIDVIVYVLARIDATTIRRNNKMTLDVIKEIIDEELAIASEHIIKRILEIAGNFVSEQKPFPNNENYLKALTLYKREINHSLVARSLGISINAAKKYYNWLVINNYLPKENTELSEVEKAVVNCIYNKKMSLQCTAKELNCSVANVVYRRDTALRKGFSPEYQE